MLKMLSETVKNFFRRPVTYNFPLEDRSAQPEYRGKQVVDLKKCISCRLCAFDCPAYAIEMKLNPANNKVYPVTDFGKCVFCYQCVQVCPTKAYIISNIYKLASFDKESLINDVLMNAGNSQEAEK
jgi:NADH-quinone oxidoreductase subunit I